jgi:D-psicose/D-tagatose/L-ribulose 3-epimerase
MTHAGTRVVDLLINTFVWYSPLTDVRLQRGAAKAAELGFDGIELPIEDHGDWDPENAARLLRDHGLSCAIGAVMPPGRELVSTDEATLRRTQDYVCRCIDAATVVGAQMVSGPLYASVGRVWRTSPQERAALVDELRDNLHPLAEYAAAAGVKLGIEPLNRYETSLLNTVEQVMEVLEELPVAGIGAALDAYHMNIEERDPAAAVRAAGSRLVHLQVSGNDRGAPGGDHIDWDALATALSEVGYSGMISIESFTPDNETIARAASIWRPLAATQDDIAIDGLAFLRPWRARWAGAGEAEPMEEREAHESERSLEP